jgi:hypothetical protein
MRRIMSLVLIPVFMLVLQTVGGYAQELRPELVPEALESMEQLFSGTGRTQSTHPH